MAARTPGRQSRLEIPSNCRGGTSRTWATRWSVWLPIFRTVSTMRPDPILRLDLGSGVAWVSSQSNLSVYCARLWTPLIPQPRRPLADFPPDHKLLTNSIDPSQTFSVVHNRTPLYCFWRHGSLNHWQLTHHSVQQSTSFIPSFDSVDLDRKLGNLEILSCSKFIGSAAVFVGCYFRAISKS